MNFSALYLYIASLYSRLHRSKSIYKQNNNFLLQEVNFVSHWLNLTAVKRLRIVSLEVKFWNEMTQF